MTCTKTIRSQTVHIGRERPGSTLLFINFSKFGEKVKTGRDKQENNRKNKPFKFS